MGYLAGFLVTLKQHRLFGGDRVTTSYSGGRISKKGKSTPGRDEKIPKPDRMHGRHVLNRYEDGMEKCIGCELCAGVCPANCIHVRGADNDAVSPTSPGERYGFVYEINYLRCIHCDLCVEACPTEAITESKLFEFSFTNRSDGIYTKSELLVDDSGKPKQLPWEDWRDGEDLNTSGWMRATSPNGDADFIGEIGWSNELGHGLRAPEPKQHLADAPRTVRAVGRGPSSSAPAAHAGRSSEPASGAGAHLASGLPLPASQAGPTSSEPTSGAGARLASGLPLPASQAGPTSSEPMSGTGDRLASETEA